jgi:hypothetical protein
MMKLLLFLDEDEDEDDDEGGSPFTDQFQELEDAIYRFPLGESGDDDMDLMIHYPDPETGMHPHMDDRMRAIHLPLWSDMGHGLGGGGLSDAVAAIGGPGGSNSHVSPNHPLLMGRQAGAVALEAGGSRNVARGIARQLHRGFRGYFHLSSRGGQNPTAPTILQNFLGSNNPQAQDLLSHGLRRGTPLLVDFGYAILDSLENEIPDIDNSVMGSGGRAALSTIPSALVRWNEESRVIDGDSMHDCVTSLKPTILEIIEKARDEELTDRKAKKKQQEEEDEVKRKANEELKKAAAVAAAEAASKEASEASTGTTTTITPPHAASAGLLESPAIEEDVIASSTPNDTMVLVPAASASNTISSTAAQMAEDLAAAISSHLSRGNLESLRASSEELVLSRGASSLLTTDNQLPPPPPFPTLPLPPPTSAMTIFVNNEGDEEDDETTGHQNSLPAALAPLSPSPEQTASGGATNDQDVTMASQNASPQQLQSDGSAVAAQPNNATTTTDVIMGFYLSVAKV